jgi:hypothetical protein
MMRANLQLRSFVALLPMFALLAGCEELDRAAGNAPAKPTTGTTIVSPLILAPDNSTPKQSSTTSNPPADASTQAATNPPPSNEPMTLQPGEENNPNLKAPEGSDGAKGQGYGGGIVTEPVRQYFNIQYRIMFDQLAHQLNIWKALNNRNPKDFDEYKKEIMEPCGVTELPELRPNCKYVYDPKTGELLVETKTGQ